MFGISGLGSGVRDLGFRVVGLGSQIPDLGFRVSGLVFRVWCFEKGRRAFQRILFMEGLGVRLCLALSKPKGPMFGVMGSGVWVLILRVSSFEFRIQGSGFGFGVSGLEFDFLGTGVWGIETLVRS